MEWLVEAGKEKEDDERFWRQLAREIVECAEGQVRDVCNNVCNKNATKV